MARTKPKPSLMVTRSAGTKTRSKSAKKKEQSPVATIRKPNKLTKPKKNKPSSEKKPPRKTKLYTIGKKVRVWWPPTRNKKRTDFSGAYWPAKVIDCYLGGVRVEYDNKECEDVDCEDISPLSVPVDFGQERTRLVVSSCIFDKDKHIEDTLLGLSLLQEKEFCEVSNDSATDPSSWLAQIAKVGKGNYTINFPFHDSEPETVLASRVRRARVFQEATRTWKLIKPGQEWEDGEISAPWELELIEELELATAFNDLSDSSLTLPVATPAIKLENGQKSKDMGSIMHGVFVSGLAGSVGAGSLSLTETQEISKERRFSLLQNRRKKKRRDPNKPKKPRSSYVYFMEQCRKEVKKENPDLRPQHIMKLMGERWAKLPNEEKELFEEMSKADKLRYHEEMKDYTSPEEAVDERGPKRTRKENYRFPKSPPTPFRLFSKDLRKKLGQELTSDEKEKRIRQAWRDATEVEKEKYAELCAEEKAQYEALLMEQQEQQEQAEQEESKKAASGLLQSLGNAGMVGYQPPPLTRTVLAAPAVDEESRKILESFDLAKVRSSIVESLLEEAYYMLLDVWREGSERLGDAIRAYKAHVQEQENPDWRAFFTAIFGNEITNSLMRPTMMEQQAPPTPPTEQPMTEAKISPKAP